MKRKLSLREHSECFFEGDVLGKSFRPTFGEANKYFSKGGAVKARSLVAHRSERHALIGLSFAKLTFGEANKYFEPISPKKSVERLLLTKNQRYFLT